MRLAVAGEEQTDAGDDEQRTEEVDDPVEAREQRGAEGDEDRAHDDRAEDAPEENAMLVDLRNGEGGEEHDEDEDVVDGERLLDDVAGEELHGLVAAEAEIDPAVEDERQRDPDPAPGERLFEADLVRLAAEDAKIEREHAEDEGAEGEPERGRGDGLHRDGERRHGGHHS